MDVAVDKAQDLELFRKEANEWLLANCPESMRQPMKGFDDMFWGGRTKKFQNDDQKNYFEAALKKGWTVPHWPKEYGGGGLSKAENIILLQEMKKLGCRPPLYSFGISMLGPALLKYGSEEQKLKYLPEIVAGDIWWCQGYSEPAAGSDLASLATSAEKKDDHYLVNGQKVWTSYADYADAIFCLVRTTKGPSKHHGISFLLIDMTIPGVSVRPIKLISGKSPFCETFFDNVKVPLENLVGEEDNGWSIAKYLLTHERTMIGDGGGSKELPLHAKAKAALGEDNGRLAEPQLRARIAQFEMDAHAYALTISRAKQEAKAGQPPGAKSSFFKLYGTELNKRKHELMMAITGIEGNAWAGDEYDDGYTVKTYLRTKGNSIEGGTSEVQLNIISKRILGLPS